MKPLDATGPVVEMHHSGKTSNKTGFKRKLRFQDKRARDLFEIDFCRDSTSFVSRLFASRTCFNINVKAQSISAIRWTPRCPIRSPARSSCSISSFVQRITSVSDFRPKTKSVPEVPANEHFIERDIREPDRRRITRATEPSDGPFSLSF